MTVYQIIKWVSQSGTATWTYMIPFKHRLGILQPAGENWSWQFRFNQSNHWCVNQLCT